MGVEHEEAQECEGAAEHPVCEHDGGAGDEQAWEVWQDCSRGIGLAEAWLDLELELLVDWASGCGKYFSSISLFCFSSKTLTRA